MINFIGDKFSSKFTMDEETYSYIPRGTEIAKKFCSERFIGM